MNLKTPMVTTSAEVFQCSIVYSDWRHCHWHDARFPQVSDHREAIEFARRRFPGVRLYALGFSMGANSLVKMLGEAAREGEQKVLMLLLTLAPLSFNRITVNFRLSSFSFRLWMARSLFRIRLTMSNYRICEHLWFQTVNMWLILFFCDNSLRQFFHEWIYSRPLAYMVKRNLGSVDEWVLADSQCSHDAGTSSFWNDWFAVETLKSLSSCLRFETTFQSMSGRPMSILLVPDPFWTFCFGLGLNYLWAWWPYITSFLWFWIGRPILPCVFCKRACGHRKEPDLTLHLNHCRAFITCMMWTCLCCYWTLATTPSWHGKSNFMMCRQSSCFLYDEFVAMLLYVTATRIPISPWRSL